MEKYLGCGVVGQFALGEAMYFGTLTLGSDKTILTLYLDAESASSVIQPYPHNLEGVLYDLTKVTLMDSIFVSGGTYTKRTPAGDYARSRQLNFDIGYVLFSDSSVSGYQHIFDILDFSIPNSNDLFSFSCSAVLANSSEQLARSLLLEDMQHGNEKFGFDEDIDTYSFGDHPSIFLYTGANVLSELKLHFGTLKIKNNPISNISSNRGFKLENKISCSLEFDEPKSFWEITKEIESILQLLDLILGKVQVLKSYKLEVNNNDKHPKVFDVYHSAHNTEVSNDFISSLDRLVHVESEVDEFETILNNWLLKQEEWKFSRGYYFSVFRKCEYNPDTLVKLSNLFDLIPNHIYIDEPVAEDVSRAVSLCKDIFDDLPKSIEKQSVMSALSRVGEKTLKHKIIDRYNVIKDSGFIDLENMNFVINQSVDCRNFFVHGNKRKFDYIQNFEEFCFLIKTLLFIYGTSEMIDAGWTFKNWKSDSLNQHTFSEYILNYKASLVKLTKTVKDFKRVK